MIDILWPDAAFRAPLATAYGGSLRSGDMPSGHRFTHQTERRNHAATRIPAVGQTRIPLAEHGSAIRCRQGSGGQEEHKGCVRVDEFHLPRRTGVGGLEAACRGIDNRVDFYHKTGLQSLENIIIRD